MVNLRKPAAIVTYLMMAVLALWSRWLVTLFGKLTGKEYPQSTQQQTNSGEVCTKTLQNIHQINADGFGDENNRYLFAMAEFQGKIYAGTSHIHNPLPGIYQFVGGKPLSTSGTQIYAYDDDEESWTNVVKHGLHDKTNFAVRKLVRVDDMLLGATVNHEKGMEVWGTLNGSDWKVLAKGGFGNKNNSSGRGLAQFNGKVYFTTENREEGAELWRIETEAIRSALKAAEDGDWTLGDMWERVLHGGLGHKSTFWFSDLVVFNKEVYMGTMNNIHGFSVYRSTDGTKFSAIAQDGITSHLHHAAMRLIEFRGQLYISTMNFINGFSLFALKSPKTSRAETAVWEEVLSNGFNNGSNAYIWQMIEFNGRLYAGTFQNSLMGLRLGMFSLYSTANGRDWTIETDMAFSPQSRSQWLLSKECGDYGIRTMLVHNNKLFMGSATAFNSCKVYTAEPRQYA